MKSLFKTCAALAAFCLLSAAALAADPSGTWKFVSPADASGGENTLVLAMEDGRLTGRLTSPGRGGRESSVKLASASFKGDVVTFTVQRTVQKARIVHKYAGKIAGDTITGKVDGPAGSDGQSVSRDWVAKRAM